MGIEQGVRLELPRVGDSEEFSRDGIAFGFANEIIKFFEPEEDTLKWHTFLNQKLQEAHGILDSSCDPIEAKSRLLGIGFRLGFFDATEVMSVIDFYSISVMSRENSYPLVVALSEDRKGGRRYLLSAFNHLPPPESWGP